jgi:hypothetical protein
MADEISDYGLNENVEVGAGETIDDYGFEGTSQGKLPPTMD